MGQTAWQFTRIVVRLAGGIALLSLIAIMLAMVIANRITFRYQGEIAYVGFSRRGADIFLLDLRRGISVDLTAVDGFDFNPTWSPDGKWIAFDTVRGNDYDVFVMDSSGHNLRRVTTDGKSGAPAWSPDGSQIAFYSYRDAATQIYVADRDGANARRITSLPYVAYNPAWSPDARSILFQANGGTFSNYRIFQVSVAGGEVEPLTSADTISFDAAWSPDSRRIALFSNADFGRDVHVMTLDEPDRLRRVSPGLGYSGSPAWSSDGRWLAYDSNGGPGAYYYGTTWSIYVVDVACLERAEGCAQAAAWVVTGLRPSWRP